MQHLFPLYHQPAKNLAAPLAFTGLSMMTRRAAPLIIDADLFTGPPDIHSALRTILDFVPRLSPRLWCASSPGDSTNRPLEEGGHPENRNIPPEIDHRRYEGGHPENRPNYGGNQESFGGNSGGNTTGPF